MTLIIIETPGKRRAWENYLRRMAMPGEVLATMGHVCTFPDRPVPVGISFDERKVDHGRKADPEKARLILESVLKMADDERILIATDPDSEGDAIALDIIDVIAAKSPDKVRSCWRVRASSLSMNAISAAVNDASHVIGNLQSVMEAAIEGRARLITDRWISATLSPQSGVPVDRVRSSVFGLISDMTEGRLPTETGEVVLMGRPANGGVTWFARYPAFSGRRDADLARIADLARRFSGRMVPGVVRPVLSLSAAVAPRFGNLRPFNTGDLVAHAARHHRIPARLAMSALQAAYMAGMISFPKTESRDLSRESAALVARLGASCGIRGLDGDICYRIGAETTRQALHPTFGSGAAEIGNLRDVLFRDWTAVFPASGGGPTESFREVVCLIVALVARRAIEAARDIVFERGRWSPTNAGGAGLTTEDMDLLESLEWGRETGQVMPWSRDMSAGVRVWPADSVLIDAMMTAEIASPATMAYHVSAIMDAGWVSEGADFDPPRLTSRGVQAGMATPSGLASVEMCRTIGRAIREPYCEDASDRFDIRVRKRVLRWTESLPADIRRSLMAALDKPEGGARRMPAFVGQKTA